MNHLKNKRYDRAVRFGGRLCRVCAIALLLPALCAAPALADNNGPLEVLNNLSDFVFAGIRAIGIIVLGWGVVQVGMSIQSHDPSQRTQGFLCLLGGLLIALAKEILGIIGVV